MTASEILARYSLGCPFIVNPEAPTPPALNADLLKDVFGGKNKTREAWITNTMSTRNCPRFDAAIEYDMNHAPQTTNTKQLREIGIFVPSTKWINESTDQDIHRILWDMVYGLATLGIYFYNTNGLSDRAMLDHLCTKVLQDKVTDIPPTPDMNEFIDLMCRTDGFVDRDRLLPLPDRSFLTTFPEDPANN